ncbi:hypothetical protein B0H14DRAFT_1339416 [Mycena olivaceomarginata]|nr:hypothetical protein B0H14DRAFT_1339416 [Mycena olivaceomarginata]
MAWIHRQRLPAPILWLSTARLPHLDSDKRQLDFPLFWMPQAPMFTCPPRRPALAPSCPPFAPTTTTSLCAPPLADYTPLRGGSSLRYPCCPCVLIVCPIHTRRAVARRHQIYISRGYAREDAKGRGGFALSEWDWSKGTSVSSLLPIVRTNHILCLPLFPRRACSVGPSLRRF